MKVHCQTCGTDFNLDESRISPDGAWVRCGICGEVFQVLAGGEAAPPEEYQPAAEEDAAGQALEEGQPIEEATSEVVGPSSSWSPPRPDPRHGPPRLGALDLSQVKGAEAERARERADFGLEERPPQQERPPRGPMFKLFFWVIGVLILAVITALGAVVVMSRLGVGQELVQRAAELPGMAALLGKETSGQPMATAQRVTRLSLVEVKSFLKDNETAGKMFVIQGKVVNHQDQAQRSVLVQGSLRDPSTGKVVKQASSYAGSVFTPAELRFMSLGVIERRLASDLAPDGSPYTVAPGEALPFMIVVANLPKPGLQFTVEVIGSEPLANKPVLK